MEPAYPNQDNRQTRRLFGKPMLIAFSILALFVASLTVAFADFSYVALPGVLLLICYVAVMSRNPGTIIFTLFLLGAPYLLSGSLLPSAIFVGVTVAIAAGAFLADYCKTPVYAILSSALAFGVAALVSSGSLERALPALITLPAYLLLALAFHRGERRSIVVAAGQVGLMLVLTGFAAAMLARAYGGLTRDAVLAFMEQLRTTLYETFLQLRDAFSSSIAEAGGELPSNFAALLDDDAVKEVVRRLTNLLPGVAAAICGVLVFFGELIFRNILLASGDDRARKPEAILYVMGIPSAAVYLLSLLFTVVLDSGTMLYAVAENLSVILLLPFFVEGAQRLIALFARLPGGARLLFLLLFFSLLCCLSVGAVEVLAFYAAVETILIPIRMRIRRRSSNDRQGD